jgi:hypothetical protein
LDSILDQRKYRTKVKSTPHDYPEPPVAQAVSSSAKTSVR